MNDRANVAGAGKSANTSQVSEGFIKATEFKLDKQGNSAKYVNKDSDDE